MVSIVALGVHRPRQMNIADGAEELGLNDVEIRRYRRAYGFENICFDPAATEQDLLSAAIENISGFGSLAPRIRFVIRPRTVRSPSPYPQSPLQDVTRRFGLTDALAFAVTDQACAGGLLAMDLAASLLDNEANDSLALILTGEKTYGNVGRIIPGVALLGEATAAIVVAAHAPRDTMLGYASQSVPIPGSGLTMGEEAMAAFGDIYASTLSEVIRQAVASADLAIGDLDAYLPHNVSRIVGIRTGRSLGLDSSRIHTANIAETAHCFSADTFINLHSAQADEILTEGDIYVMTSVGLGATFSAAVFRH